MLLQAFSPLVSKRICHEFNTTLLFLHRIDNKIAYDTLRAAGIALGHAQTQAMRLVFELGLKHIDPGQVKPATPLGVRIHSLIRSPVDTIFESGLLHRRYPQLYP